MADKGHLTISFGRFAADTGIARVPLEIINDEFRSVFNGTLSLSANDSTKVELAPGRYVVRSYLPSGEIAAAQASVADGSTTDVQLKPDTQSARESLSWAYYLKRTPAQAGTARSGFGWMPPGFDSQRERPRLDLWVRSSDGQWNSRAQDLKTGSSVAAQFASVVVDDSVSQDDGQAVQSIEIQSPGGWRYNLGQCWLQVRFRGGSQFLALPPSPRMRVLIVHPDADEPSRQGLDLIADGGNPLAESILGYLANSAFDSARQVGDAVMADARKLLYDKRDDASGAIIGGYLLLAAGRLRGNDDESGWIQNLANFFPWLPDGAVIDGWRLLRQPKSSPEQARDRLVEAANRGIPLFTMGLRLLFDGLSLFSRNQKLTSPAVTGALEDVRPYAAAADRIAPNTMHFGHRPDDPQPAG